MASQGGNATAVNPPYAPTTAILGGQPTPRVDDPICAVLLVLYIAAAVTNITIFLLNRKRDHNFVPSGLFFGFCTARTATLCLRIGWASRPRNVRLGIAATILVQAGVLLLFIDNLVFTQRVVRSYHPRVGWSRGLKIAFMFLLSCIIGMLIMVIIAAVYMFFTLNAAVHLKLRIITLVAGTFLAVLAFLPMPIVAISLLTRTPGARPEKFGIGRYRTRLLLLTGTSFLLSLGAGFRAGVNYTTPRPLTDPAWYHSKACFYCFNFGIELLVVYTYTIFRFDRRMHVPDGSSGPGHYSGSRMPDDHSGGSPRKHSSARQQRQPDVAEATMYPFRPQGGLSAHRGYHTSSRTLAVSVGDGFGSSGSLHNPAESPKTQKQRQSEWEAIALKEMDGEAAQFPIVQ